MSRTFLSLLGTGDYLDCRYQLGEDPGEVVKYIQEYLIGQICHNWTNEDLICIFATDQSKTANWEDDGHREKQGRIIKNKGLQERLAAMGMQAEVRLVTIPIGNKENELWQIFDIFLQNIREHARIYLDITHSFRSLPLLLTVLMNYARIMKRISIEGIYYGAFETLGSRPKAELIPVDQRIAPVFDLTSLSRLQEWTLAAHHFMENGIADELVDLAESDVRAIMKETKGQDKAARQLYNLINDISKMSSNFYTARGRDIVQFDYERPNRILAELEQSDIFIRPLVPVLEQLQGKLKPFKKGQSINGIFAVDWCLENNLIPQGITLLQETVIGLVLERHELDTANKDIRGYVTAAYRFLSEKKPENKWNIENEEDKALIRAIMQDQFVLDTNKEMDSLSQLRNDVNHAGFLDNAVDSSRVRKRFEERYTTLREKIFEHFSQT